MSADEKQKPLGQNQGADPQKKIVAPDNIPVQDAWAPAPPVSQAASTGSVAPRLQAGRGFPLQAPKLPVSRTAAAESQPSPQFARFQPDMQQQQVPPPAPSFPQLQPGPISLQSAPVFGDLQQAGARPVESFTQLQSSLPDSSHPKAPATQQVSSQDAFAGQIQGLSPQTRADLKGDATPFNPDAGQSDKALNVLRSALKRKARPSRSWHWPEDESGTSKIEDESQQEILPARLGLLKNTELNEVDESSGKNSFARAIEDYDLARLELREESQRFAELSREISGVTINSEPDARACLEKLALSLSCKSAARELIELAPRLSGMVKNHPALLADILEICRMCERGKIAPEALSKVLEQLNRVCDAPILPARRDLAIEHFLRACSAAATNEIPPCSDLELSRNFLLRNYPDRAAGMLFSILTSTRANTEELAIKPFKFDSERARAVVKVPRNALEAEPGMRKRENIMKQNYFAHLLSSVAVNAVLQCADQRKRYASRRGETVVYLVEEEEVRTGVFKAICSKPQSFEGLTYDEMSWINRHFAGLRLKENIPQRLRFY